MFANEKFSANLQQSRVRFFKPWFVQMMAAKYARLTLASEDFVDRSRYRTPSRSKVRSWPKGTFGSRSVDVVMEE